MMFLPPAYRKKPLVAIRGKVYGVNKVLKDAVIFVFDSDSERFVKKEKVYEDGSFFLFLSPKKRYEVLFVSKGYWFSVKKVDFRDVSGYLEKNFYETLIPLSKGDEFDLRNRILFGKDEFRYIYKGISYIEGIYYILRYNPDLKVKISIFEKHTDSVIKNSYNRWLAKEKAIAIKDYLTLLGINEERILIDTGLKDEKVFKVFIDEF